jgi:hypothetical protein
MKYKKKEFILEAFPVKGCEVTITATDGTHIARDGDWIVKGIKGELYPVANDVFMKLYEAIPDGS